MGVSVPDLGVSVSLTLTDIRNAKPKLRPYKLADSRGLFLLVTPMGAKSWRYKYRYGTRERLLTLGLYPDLGLVAAREAHDEARKILLSGRDPVAEQQKRRQAQIHASQATFRKIGNEWLEDQAPLWSEANAKRVRNRLERDLYPAFGNFPVGEIDSSAILRALRRIEARGSIETAKRVRGYILAIFRRAKAERLVSHPIILEIEEIKDALKRTPPGSKQPALTTIAELFALQSAVDRSSSSAIIKLASRLLALTVVRVGVLRTATWDEFAGIDWGNPEAPVDQAIWHIPSGRMKLEVEDKGNAAFGHDVPLPSQAVALLRALRTLTGSSPYLFPGAKSWKDPMTDAALSTLYKRMAGGMYKNQMVPHGWRSAFSTIMNERAAELERDGDRMIIDMILAHVPRGMSASEWAYNRARYRKPRGTLHQIWADLVTEGLPPPHSLLPAG